MKLTEDQKERLMALKTGEEVSEFFKAENIDAAAIEDDLAAAKKLSVDDLENVAGGRSVKEVSSEGVVYYDDGFTECHCRTCGALIQGESNGQFWFRYIKHLRFVHNESYN